MLACVYVRISVYACVVLCSKVSVGVRVRVSVCMCACMFVCFAACV